MDFKSCRQNVFGQFPFKMKCQWTKTTQAIQIYNTFIYYALNYRYITYIHVHQIILTEYIWTELIIFFWDPYLYLILSGPQTKCSQNKMCPIPCMPSFALSTTFNWLNQWMYVHVAMIMGRLLAILLYDFGCQFEAPGRASPAISGPGAPPPCYEDLSIVNLFTFLPVMHSSLALIHTTWYLCKLWKYLSFDINFV